MPHSDEPRYPYNAYDPLSDRAHVKSIHPYDPFEDTALAPSDVRGTKARSYWAEYSERPGADGWATPNKTQAKPKQNPSKTQRNQSKTPDKVII